MLWLHNPQVTQLAALAANTDNPTVWLFNLGTAGVWLICMITRLLVTKKELDEMRQERDDARADAAAERKEKDALRDQLMQSLPTMANAAQVMAQQAVPVIRQADISQAQLAETFAQLIARAERVLDDGQA